jgi:hypothetical protein
LYYYSRHLLIDAEKIQIFDFIFAILISTFIPVTIKLFGSHIRAKEWTEEISDKKINCESDKNIEIKNETFNNSRPDYKSGDRGMIKIFAEF